VIVGVSSTPPDGGSLAAGHAGGAAGSAGTGE
jgi:hypothetical protein